MSDEYPNDGVRIEEADDWCARSGKPHNLVVQLNSHQSTSVALSDDDLRSIAAQVRALLPEPASSDDTEPCAAHGVAEPYEAPAGYVADPACTCPRTTVAQPAAEPGDVDALADEFRRVAESDPSPTWTTIARYFLASDWLARHDAEVAAQALENAAAAEDLDAAEDVARSRKADVRCISCNLRYEERQQYGCHESGRGHHYDDDDLRDAAKVVIEPTWDGDRLRERAVAIREATR